MDAFNDTRRGHVELGDLRIEDRLLALDVAAARLPGDPGVAGGREHERGYGIAADGVALDGTCLRRKDVHVEINDSEIKPVDETARQRQGEPAPGVLLGYRQLVLHLDVKRSLLPGEQLLGWPRACGGLNEVNPLVPVRHS